MTYNVFGGTLSLTQFLIGDSSVLVSIHIIIFIINVYLCVCQMV